MPGAAECSQAFLGTDCTDAPLLDFKLQEGDGRGKEQGCQGIEQSLSKSLSNAAKGRKSISWLKNLRMTQSISRLCNDF